MTHSPAGSGAGHAFIQARDLLLAHRTSYELAVAGFRWPALDQFNWALDYFDVIAAGKPADGAAHRRGRRDRARPIVRASCLRARTRSPTSSAGLGVRRGDRLLLMLGNEVALWETLLAAMKLGAVVSPATPLLTPADLAGSHRRAVASRHVVAATRTPRSSTGSRRVSRGSPSARRRPGWRSLRRSRGAPRSSRPMADDMRTRSAAALLHVRHHREAQAGAAHAPELSGRPPVDDVLDRAAARRRHWNISSPGWAKHAWSCFFAPWNAAATIFIFNYARFQAKTRARRAGHARRHHAVRAPDGLAHARSGAARPSTAWRCASCCRPASR